MIVKYNNFILEHMDMAKSIISKKMEAYDKLKVLLKNNLGYIGKFTQFLMEENIPYQELENLFKELSDLKSKNASFDIQNLKYEKVLDQIEQVKIDLSVKSVVNQFPSEQKKLAKEMMSDTNYGNIRNVLHKISQKEDIGPFISKVSRYKDKHSLYAALKVFCKSTSNKKEEVLQNIQKSKSQLVYNDQNLLIIHIKSYEDIKEFGSDTSWCIVPSESTFNSYTRGRNQFVLYNYDLDEYDPKFKMGFTLNKDLSIHAAHDILDGGVKDNLRNLFESKGLTFAMLFKKDETKKSTLTIDQILPRTANGPISEFAGTCEKKDIIPLIKKLISFPKSKTYKMDTISLLMERLYDGVGFIYEKEIVKIDPKILDYLNKNVEKRVIYSKWEYGIFASNYESWEYIESQIKAFSDTELLRLSESDFSYIACRSSYRHQIREDFNREIMTKISDRLNALARLKPMSEKLDHFFVTCLLFNASLGRKEQTPHYQEVAKMVTKSMYSKYYYKILNLPIDAAETYFGSDIKLDMIPLIIKKDYTIRIATIDFNNLEICDKITEHLKGNKVAFGISAKAIRWYFGKIRENSPLLNIINQFQITKLRKGQEKTVGDITIRIV